MTDSLPVPCPELQALLVPDSIPMRPRDALCPALKLLAGPLKPARHVMAHIPTQDCMSGRAHVWSLMSDERVVMTLFKLRMPKSRIP